MPGFEGFEGLIFNAADPGAWNEFNITSVRLGIGLGGGAELGLLFAFNISDMWTVDNSRVTDWEFNFGLGEKWSPMVNSLRVTGFLRVAFAIAKARRMIPVPLDFLELARNAVHAVWAWRDASENLESERPAYVSLDTPLSYSREVSLSFLDGTISVSNIHTKPTLPL